jgi:hypothetical protein
MPAILLSVASTVAMLAIVLTPDPSTSSFAVITPPWFDSARTMGLIESAGGSIVDMGGMPNIIVAHSNDPGFVKSLYRAGAWLVVNPLGAGGCAGAISGKLKTFSNE